MEKEEAKEKNRFVLISPHYFFIILVGLLLVFSIIQAFQISSVEDGLKGNSVITEGSSGEQVVLRSPAKQAAPAMVGGS